MFNLPRTVVVLSLVSMLNDAASDMIAPLLPVLLIATLGAGPVIVGLIEGIAEATASLLKFFSGRLADRGVRPRRLVIGGYSLSNAARPLIGLAASWPLVLLLRFLDRVGKGLRSAPRDAMIAAVTPPERRGAAFGFHRALDNGGAVIGPLCAFFLLAAQVPLVQVFLWSTVFGVAVLALLVFGVDPDTGVTRPPAAATALSTTTLSATTPVIAPAPLRWSLLDDRLKGIVVAAALLSASAIPEVFLILWATGHGLPLVYAPLIWAAANFVKVLVAAPAGSWSDRAGRLPVLVTGWTLRVAMLLVLAFAPDVPGIVWAGFLGYAGAIAFTEGAERAVIADAAPPGLRATVYGLYYMTSGLLALPGALLVGWLWEHEGAAAACVLSAVMAALAALVMVRETMRTSRSA